MDQSYRERSAAAWLGTEPLARRLRCALTQHRVVLAAIAAAGLFLRLHLLGDQSFWRDEVASVEIARLPVSQLWSSWMVHETNPPLYYTLLHVWQAVFGDSEFAVRGLSAAIGTVAIVCAGLLGRKLVSERVGQVAAALTAVSALQVYFSQEARGYMLAAVAVLVALIALAEITDQVCGAPSQRTAWSRRGVWITYTLAVTAAMYTHTTMVLLLAPTNAYFAWLWLRKGNRDVGLARAWIAVNIACVLLWSWWGWITFQQMSMPNGNIGWMKPPAGGLFIGVVEDLYGPRRASLTLISAGAAVSLAMVATALFGVRRMRHPLKWLLAAIAFAMPVAFFLVSGIQPIFMEKTVFWTQGAFLVLLSAGLCALPSRPARTVLTALAVVILAADTLDSERVPVKQPWREASALIQKGWQKGDVVLVDSPTVGVIIQHYFRKSAFRAPVVALNDAANGVSWAPDLFHGTIVDPKHLPDALRGFRRIWVASEPRFDPTRILDTVGRPLETTKLPYYGFDALIDLRVSLSLITPRTK